SEHNFSANPPGAADDWRQLRGGFRMDGNRNVAENWMVQGEVYRGFNGETLTTPVIPATAFDETSITYATDMEVKGADLLGRWANSYAADAEVPLQLYYDTISRKETIFEEVHDTFDIDLQHRFPLTSAQELVWGMGYRLLKSDTAGSDTYSFDPNRRTNQLWSLFIQDEATLLPEKLVFIAGSKVEHNVFTGAEVQPNARLIWTPTAKQSLWSAVSRAVRTPSLNEVDARTQVGAFAYQYFDDTTFSMATSRNTIQILGNPRFESEELTAYEIGYRFTPVDTLSFDIATFYNDYDKLLSVVSETPYYTTTPAPDHTVMPLRFNNDMTGKAYGVEIAANWQPTARLKLLASYS
ncbi:MAG: iron complex outermembrane recepter protein, partial [Halothiobacillaceae bacterium]